MVQAFCLGTSTGPAINSDRSYSLNNPARTVVRAHQSVRFAVQVALPATRCGTTKLTITWQIPVFIPHGYPALILRVGGAVDTVLAVRIDGGLITGLYGVRNPEKLSRMRQETAPRR